jgi:excisionase family DNA binding protein
MTKPKRESFNHSAPTGERRGLRFFTIPDVAESSQVSARTVRRWIESGELIAYRFGRSVRIADEDLRGFQAQRRGV